MTKQKNNIPKESGYNFFNILGILLFCFVLTARRFSARVTNSPSRKLVGIETSTFILSNHKVIYPVHLESIP